MQFCMYSVYVCRSNCNGDIEDGTSIIKQSVVDWNAWIFFKFDGLAASPHLDAVRPFDLNLENAHSVLNFRLSEIIGTVRSISDFFYNHKNVKEKLHDIVVWPIL